MNLLSEEDLIWSPIVANCRMNRERNLVGINSYEKDLGFNILSHLSSLVDQIAPSQTLTWIDVCCGQGKAILQAAQEMAQWPRHANIQLSALDLVDGFETGASQTSVQFYVDSLVNWQAPKSYDLITCVHGLHYVGDKLGVLQKLLHCLKVDAYLLANIDLDNIRDAQNKSLKKRLIRAFHQLGISYNARKRLLRAKGPQTLPFHFAYLGADDQAGKNYTGMEVIHSIYDVGTSKKR